MSPIRDLIDDLRQEDFDDAADLIERLMAENAKLREALKPFAEEALQFGDHVPDTAHPASYQYYAILAGGERAMKCFVGDFRRAAALLKEGK